MKARTLTCMMLSAVVLLIAPVPLVGQDHGSGGSGGGGSGCGDVFGDLIHIKRHETTGQPILAQRWVELPRQEPGYGWGYCPIAVYTIDGLRYEIPFVPYTCDPDPDFLDLVEEVDYFGRLNGGRTKERNNRMHFNEVIRNIKAGDIVKKDPAGRLMIGFDCAAVGEQPCAEFSTVDSPMASMGLYTRLMKYGHLATDPYEVDAWAHGDPKLPTQFHPALGVEDWPKFHPSLSHLLPEPPIPGDPSSCWDFSQAEWFDDANGNGAWDPAEPFIDIDKDGEFDCCAPRPEPFTDLDADGSWDPAESFEDANGNGVADAFTFLCAGRESLDNKDLLSAASCLAGAANKGGKFTVDLVQYMNRILKITKPTPHTVATDSTLPALYRDCWNEEEQGGDPQDPPEEGGADDPPYSDTSDCEIVEADPEATPNYDLFTDVQEKFVDFDSLTDYGREGESVEVIVSTSKDTWIRPADDVELLDWIDFVSPPPYGSESIEGFVGAANDALRAIEFIHNYAIPEDLYCKYDSESCL